MNVLPQCANERLLWVDLEMTGLDPTRDVILEVAAIVTDWEFTESAQFESGVGQDVARVENLLDLNDFYTKYPDNKRALIDLTRQAPSPATVERQLIDFVKKYCDMARPIVLCGNSIHMDRQFIRVAWPQLDRLLHYRMLDVTAWKLVMESRGVTFQKQEKHRALDDIRESIAELRFYMARFD